MELQVLNEFHAQTEAWSVAESFVIFGWLSGLVTCCFWVGKGCCPRRCLGSFPRVPQGDVSRAESNFTEYKEASVQTILCTPPSTIDMDSGTASGPTRRRPLTPEPIAVYSTFKKKGNNSILEDMVVMLGPWL